MRLCICSSWQFVDTFEISLRKQIIQGKPECDYAFVQAGSLTTSEISHTGEKSYKCIQCDYACVLAGDLRRHLETNSGKKSSKCNHCYFESV